MNIEPIARMSRDLSKAALTLSDDEARFLVDAYYLMQENRIRTDAQVRSMGDEPHAVLAYLADQNRTLENQIKRALDKYTDAHPVGPWLKGVKGIGPVIAAGLLAHIDITKAPTVGHIWAFAGLDPTKQWKKGEKRPHNARLKTLCWKAGESFVKVSGHDDAFYGKLWREQKDRYIAKNEAGGFADRAAQILETRKIGKATDAYKAYSAGKLPPAHIHAMSRRWAVKLFLAHLHGEMYRTLLGEEPPKPYAIAHLDHAHEIKPVN